MSDDYVYKKEVDWSLFNYGFAISAFKNDPEVVARAYKVAIEEFPKVFEKVEFAVYCTSEDETNYQVFQKVLGE